MEVKVSCACEMFYVGFHIESAVEDDALAFAVG